MVSVISVSEMPVPFAPIPAPGTLTRTGNGPLPVGMLSQPHTRRPPCEAKLMR